MNSEFLCVKAAVICTSLHCQTLCIVNDLYKCHLMQVARVFLCKFFLMQLHYNRAPFLWAHVMLSKAFVLNK